MKPEEFSVTNYIENLPKTFPSLEKSPWMISSVIEELINAQIRKLSDDFVINGSIAIHRNAKVEDHIVMKGAIIIGPDCFVGAHAYLRGGVFLQSKVVIGPGCEVKSSIIHSQSALAHFNFVGDSIIGSNVNMEAGSVIANHYNERKDKTISVRINEDIVAIPSQKFGAIVGDGTRIGANAVLSPGTILHKNSIVKRLELIEQCEPLP